MTDAADERFRRPIEHARDLIPQPFGIDQLEGTILRLLAGEA